FTDSFGLVTTLMLLVFFVIVEWLGRSGDYAISQLFLNKNRAVRWAFYGLLVFFIGMYVPSIETPFIYFQF
ncbi:MAG: MBOAT family protein, partial [Flavobacteriales bacterium]